MGVGGGVVVFGSVCVRRILVFEGAPARVPGGDESRRYVPVSALLHLHAPDEWDLTISDSSPGVIGVRERFGSRLGHTVDDVGGHMAEVVRMMVEHEKRSVVSPSRKFRWG